MKIFVLGWYNHDNVGDESYKIAFPLVFPQHNFTFSDRIPVNIHEYQAIILGGGNVLKPYFLEQLKNLNLPIYAISVGCEKENVLNIPFTRIITRDHWSEQIINLQQPCDFMPDLAFIMQPDPIKGKEWIEKEFKNKKLLKYEKIVTIVINGYLASSPKLLARDMLSFMNVSYSLAQIADNTNASFVFVPFGTGFDADDRMTNSWTASKCKFWEKNLLIYDSLNPQLALDIISASNLCISSRLHSSIFAYNANVPFIDITHHDKNAGFVDLVKAESVNYWDFSKEKINCFLETYLWKPNVVSQSVDFKELIRNKTNAICFGQ